MTRIFLSFTCKNDLLMSFWSFIWISFQTVLRWSCRRTNAWNLVNDSSEQNDTRTRSSLGGKKDLKNNDLKTTYHRKQLFRGSLFLFGIFGVPNRSGFSFVDRQFKISIDLDHIEQWKMQEIWNPFHRQNYLISKRISNCPFFKCPSVLHAKI